MSKYPLLDKLGLTVTTYQYNSFWSLTPGGGGCGGAGGQDTSSIETVSAEAVNKILEYANVVYSNENISHWYNQPATFHPGHVPDTHTARLLMIEKIKPKECEHEASLGLPTPELVCSKCNVKLKAKWEPAE